MILGLDTDVLVHWAMAGAENHRAVRRSIAHHVSRGVRLGLTPAVLHEFIHVCTDGRRFENPLSMPAATGIARTLWDSREVERILASATTVHRTLELLETLGLGRKRILDTALAATFEAADVTRIATLNAADFEIFPFLEVFDPTARRRRRSK